MANVYKILGQAAPAASTSTSLYIVPVGKFAVCSTLVIANRGASTSYRVAVRPAGETLSDKHYIVYDAQLNQYDSAFLTIGISSRETDVVEVFSGTATLSFSLFGTEVTP